MGWSNRRQEVALALIPKFSSVLSLLGSVWIIVEVLTDKSGPRPKWNHPYHRLLFAMSIYDILESVWNFFSTWPIPAGTEGVAWARGNTATCTAQGFFLTLGVAIPIYNALLALYYVLVIRYKYSDEALRNWVEPMMHLVAGGWAFFTALYAAFTGLINNANLWCWIAPLPGDCLDSRGYGDEGNCVRGDNAWIYRWAFYFAPLWLSIFLATIFTYMVYAYVKDLDESTLKYRRPEQRFSYLNTSLPTPSEMESHKQRVTSRQVTFAHTPDGEAQELEEPDNILSVDDSDDSGSAVQYPSTPEENTSSGRDTGSPVTVSSSTNNSKPVFTENNPQSGETEDSTSSTRRLKLAESAYVASVRNVVSRWHSSRQESHRRFTSDYKRTLEVYHQALWYVGMFYITHVWSTSNRIIQFIFDGNSFFPLVTIHAWFDPLQGFLNYLVYQRPRYLKLRKKYPRIGRLGALHRMLKFTYLPDPEHWENDKASKYETGASKGIQSAQSTGSRNSLSS